MKLLNSVLLSLLTFSWKMADQDLIVLNQTGEEKSDEGRIFLVAKQC